jgi:hypothetical protein
MHMRWLTLFGALLSGCRAEFHRANIAFPSNVAFMDPMLVAAEDLKPRLSSPLPTLRQAYAWYCGEGLPDFPSTLDKARAVHEVMLEQN